LSGENDLGVGTAWYRTGVSRERPRPRSSVSRPFPADVTPGLRGVFNMLYLLPKVAAERQKAARMAAAAAEAA
jgi:hypothetical protein